MPSTSGYCTEADVKLALSSAFVTQLVDYDKNSTEDTGVLQWHIDTASYMIRSIAISPREDLKDLSALAVVDFTTTTAAYGALRRMTAQLAADFARGAYRQNQDGVMPTHPSLVWARMVALKQAELG